MRGLRVPSSYMPTGPDDGTATYQDGRVGTALIQEYRFSKYIERIQNILQATFDREFKKFLTHRGVQVSSALFDLGFVEPQSFSQYRELELDQSRAQLFGQLEGVPYLSRRFILGKYLGLDEDEIAKNEAMWRLENDTDAGPEANSAGDLGSLGLRGGDVEGFAPTDVDAETAGDEMGGDDSDSPVPDQGDDDEI